MALLAQIAAAVAFFVLIYAWKDNRFVLYWTVPALLLAGHAIACAAAAVRLPLLAFAVLAGNLTSQANLSPLEPEIVWSLGSATSLDYHTDQLRPAAGSVDPVSAKLAALVRKRRLTFSDPNAEDPFYTTSRAAAAREAVLHLDPGERLRAYVDPAMPSVVRYILRNHLILLTRHPVELQSLEPGSASLGEGDVAIILGDSLVRHGGTLPPYEIIGRFGRHALIRARSDDALRRASGAAR
jgi:hypothetical protein